MNKVLQNPKHVLKAMLLSVLFAAAPFKSAAQVASQIQDIFPFAGNSSPALFTYCGTMNAVFFVADDGFNGQELWKYDISSGTAMMVKDINTGSGSSGITSIMYYGTANVVVFNANDGTNGNELWKSDGTPGGTVMVKDINAGAGNSTPSNFYIFGGQLLFSADNGTNGKEPWVSNATSGGTAMLKDINSGVAASDPNLFTALGTKVLFRANDGVNGSELWSTDMTAANTVLLKDVNTGSVSSVPLNLTVVNTTLFFSALTAANGAELWKTDGTTGGTSLVKDINSGAGSSITMTPGAKAYFTAMGPNLYFQATDGSTGYELWKSDGTSGGTVLVKDIQSGSSSSMPSGILATPNSLYFTANDGTNGTEVWMSDGTSGGTTLLKDINPGSASGTSTLTTFVKSGSGVVYFAANDGVAGTELWQTVGTAMSTTLSADVNPGAGSASPANMMVANNIVYFAATDGTTGIEPWRFDPTPTGITSVNADAAASIYPNPAKEYVYIKSQAKEMSVQIFSVNGACVYSEKVDNANSVMINVGNLSRGIYFVKINSDNASFVKKLVLD